MLSFLRKKRRTRGLIEHLALVKWWETELTEADRERIVAHYQPMGSSGSSLTDDQILSTSQSPLHLLWGLATWFKDPDDYRLALKIINKGEELAPQADPIDAHFLFQAKIEIAYRNRDAATGALDIAIQACEQQIEIAPRAADRLRQNHGPDLPSHKGYTQLAIIREKQSQFEEAARLCIQAEQEGWAGDWIARITRLNKKTSRQSK